MTRASTEAPLPWTAEEDKRLLDCAHGKLSSAVIAKSLGRTGSAVRCRLAPLAKYGNVPAKTPRRDAWLPAHDVHLRALVAEGKSVAEIAGEMGRAESCIKSHKRALGLLQKPAGEVVHTMHPNGVPAKAAAVLAEHGAMSLTRLSLKVGRSAKSLTHSMGSAVSAGLICHDNAEPFAKRMYWVPGNPPKAAPAEVLPAGGDFSFAVRRAPAVIAHWPELSARTLGAIATRAALDAHRHRAGD